MKEKSKRTKFLSEYSYIAVYVIILIVYVITNHGLTMSGFMNIFRHSAVIGIIGFGMGLICLTGDIDLSAVGFGAVCGLINGMLVGYGKIPAFIATLATMLIYRSFAQYYCQHIDKNLIGGGSSVYRMANANTLYQAMYNMGNGKVLTVPIVGILLIAVTIIFVYLTTETKYGKQIYAVGSNAKAARMTGIDVDKVKVSVFVIAGALVGLASFVWIAMNASADPATTGSSYEMYAIAAVVLGGISMSGGRGKMLCILFGAMSYTVIDKIIVALKMDSLINDAIKGIILIVVIMIQIVSPRIKEKIQKR